MGKKEEPKPVEPEKPVPKWKKPAAPKEEEQTEEPEPTQTNSVLATTKEPEQEILIKPESDTKETVNSAVPASDLTVNNEEEKKEDEAEEEDVTGMRAMRKEQASKFSDMDAEFAAGASKLSALRAKMKALRMKHKAAAEADAAA